MGRVCSLSNTGFSLLCYTSLTNFPYLLGGRVCILYNAKISHISRTPLLSPVHFSATDILHGKVQQWRASKITKLHLFYNFQVFSNYAN